MNLDIASPYDYNAEARFERTPIPASIPASLRNQFAISEGVITGSVRARGTLSRPLEAAARADLDELEVTLKGTPHQAATIRNTGRLAGPDHRGAR